MMERKAFWGLLAARMAVVSIGIVSAQSTTTFPTEILKPGALHVFVQDDAVERQVRNSNLSTPGRALAGNVFALGLKKEERFCSQFLKATNSLNSDTAHLPAPRRRRTILFATGPSICISKGNYYPFIVVTITVVPSVLQRIKGPNFSKICLHCDWLFDITRSLVAIWYELSSELLLLKPKAQQVRGLEMRQLGRIDSCIGI